MKAITLDSIIRIYIRIISHHKTETMIQKSLARKVNNDLLTN